MPLITDQAVCIRHWDWSETSQTVSLFSRTHGVIRGVAKGAKREKSTFSGGIELMTRGEVVASLKNTDAMSTLTAWDLLETFSASRATLAGFFGAMAMLDIVQHSMVTGDPHPGFFDALVVGLRTLGTAGADRLAVTRVAWSSLIETGHAPELELDIRTQSPLLEAPIYGFWPGLGGFSRQVTPEAMDAEASMQTVWKVRSETLEYLRHLARAAAEPSEQHAAGLNDDTSGTTSKRCLQLLLAYFRFVFNTEAQAFAQFVTQACA